LPCGVLSGTTTVHATPLSRAANATAWPWLPLLCVHTPAFLCSAERDSTAFSAPRALNDPVFCMFSHLKKKFLPNLLSSVDEVITGVALGKAPRILSFAACTLWTVAPWTSLRTAP
jgi:hypothetical protein